MSTERVNFGSKIGVILATADSAVGLGNIWRFPYMTGQNGGAAFIIIYIVCVLLLGIPCMVSECIIGRRGAANTARAYANLSNGTPWRWVGFLGVMTGFLITGYYTVISGWCLQYVYAAGVSELTGDKAYIQSYFAQCSETAWRPVLWTVAFMLATHFIVIRGIERGIERASKVLMPILFLLLTVIVIAACSLPDGVGGVRFLFQPDFSKVNGHVFFSALGQSFYSLSIAMGCICTYASYYSRKTNLLGSALQVAALTH